MNKLFMLLGISYSWNTTFVKLGYGKPLSKSTTISKASWLTILF